MIHTVLHHSPPKKAKVRFMFPYVICFASGLLGVTFTFVQFSGHIIWVGKCSD